MKVAVIGAGWAGLSAAFYLDRAGHRVTVFEAARTLGGRARRVHSPRLDSDIDNGQHILLGAYSETLKLIGLLGLDQASVLHAEPLALRSADGSFMLRTPALPAPLHLPAAVLTANGLSWREKLLLIKAMMRLRRQHWTVDAQATVGDWLAQERQSERAIGRFWRPLCLAALNTSIEQAGAQLLATVLRDSLGGSKLASQVLIPRVDLSQLWPEHLPPSIAIRPGTAVRRLVSDAVHVAIDDETFDAAIVATSPPSALRLLRHTSLTAAQEEFLAPLADFEYRPIATLTLKLAHHWNLPQAMLMLDDAPEKLHFGQWLFERRLFAQDQQLPPMLSIVVSNAGQLANHPPHEVVDAMIEQVRAQTRHHSPMPQVTGHELIVEKRATFAALPAMRRPTNATPWPRIWLAGDWTDTGYPAVLEGAVRSGKRAAELLAATDFSPHSQTL